MPAYAHDVMKPLKRNILPLLRTGSTSAEKKGQPCSCLHHPVKETKSKNGRCCTSTTLALRDGKKTHPYSYYVGTKACSPAIYSSCVPVVFLPFGFKQILAVLFSATIMPSHMNQILPEFLNPRPAARPLHWSKTFPRNLPIIYQFSSPGGA